MKSIELDRIGDTGRAFQADLAQRFGPSQTAPETLKINDYDKLIANLRGVVIDPRLPGSRLIPVAQNLNRLKEAEGKVFAVQVGTSLRPAVITDRSTTEQIHLTYLAGENDMLNPVDLELTDFQRSLLQKVSRLQRSSVGTAASHGQSTATEFGHGPLGIAAVLNPRLLDGEHLVHAWTASDRGIGGYVTDPEVATIYDVKLRDGDRTVREASTTLSSGVLIDHPAFHEVRQAGDITTEDFAAGLGIVAVSSQLGTGNVQARILESLELL